MSFSTMVFQHVLLTPSLTESQAADLKTGLKIACLVIALSGAGIFGALTGFSGNHTSVTSKLLFKACMLSMSICFLSGVVLLVLTITRPNFQYLILVTKTVIWAAIGLVTLVVALVLAFNFLSA